MLGWMGEENIKGQKARDQKHKNDRSLSSKSSFFVSLDTFIHHTPISTP